MYIPDHQQPGEDATEVAESVIELASGADLLIHDAQFDDAEFRSKSDWGHCTVSYAVRVAAEAQVSTLWPCSITTPPTPTISSTGCWRVPSSSGGVSESATSSPQRMVVYARPRGQSKGGSARFSHRIAAVWRACPRADSNPCRRTARIGRCVARSPVWGVSTAGISTLGYRRWGDGSKGPQS